MSADPLFATQRLPGRLTAAAQAVDVAEVLGFDLQPWQRLALDVGLELDDGRLAHRDVTVSTPRQAGKSVLVFVVLLARLLSAPDQFLLYGAQNRMSARTRLIDGWWPRLAKSAYADQLSLSRGAGFEALRHENGSVLRLLSSEESSGHGDSVDLVLLDECWALDAYVEQAVRPATIARPGSQIWSVSTAGTARSVWFRSKVDAGRAAAVSGAADPAYLEWAAPPGADAGDPAVWRAAHPAIGFTIDEATIAADYAVLPTSEFRRAYLNQWPGSGDEGWRLMDKDAWEQAAL